MDKQEALALFDAHTKILLNPVDMLRWVRLRVIILNIPEDVWEQANNKMVEVTSR